MESTADEIIRTAREVFNSAIADKDIITIKTLLAPQYHIVTGRSDQNHGADEEARRWAETFRADPTAIYIRTPREVTINEDWGLAQETGSWQGSYTAEGILVEASGVYSAKWQRAESGAWLIQVEVFTTLACAGPCKKPDAI